MSRETLINLAKDNIYYAKSDSVSLAEDVMRVPARKYTDHSLWDLEQQKIFRRLPLLLGMSCELPTAGCYLAKEAAGVPIIITRDEKLQVNAMLNSCAHRGAQILQPGSGKAKRLSCPYHAWSYTLDGSLSKIFASDIFGEIEKSEHNLIRLPAYESAGLIWVNTDPHSKFDISDYLCGYDELLAEFDFENWKIFDRRSISGPNWKIAYDGYLDLYHLPILHRKTFGADMPFKSLTYSWGPHTRVTSPDLELVKEAETNPIENFAIEKLTSGVWTIFPHVSIASFEAGCRGVLISQLFPGSNVSESITTQTYLISREISKDEEAEAKAMFDLLETVVSQEDYLTGKKQQEALKTGLRDDILLGRNEEGCQRFHDWVSTIINCPDEELGRLFNSADRWRPSKK